jgi:hypothetical protein
MQINSQISSPMGNWLNTRKKIRERKKEADKPVSKQVEELCSPSKPIHKRGDPDDSGLKMTAGMKTCVEGMSPTVTRPKRKKR